MTASIQTYIQGLLEKRAKLPSSFNAQSDYIKAGIIDSMGLIKFMLEIEAEYDIELNEDDIEQPAFRTLAGLSEMVHNKCAAKENA